MNCREAQSLIDSYIDKSITTGQLQQFLEHVEHCDSCYDELETNFIVRSALRQLEDENEDTLNIGQLLRQDLKQSRRIVRHHRLLRIIVSILIAAVLFGVIFELLRCFGILF